MYPKKGYPAPKARSWKVQVEFFDGTTIDATSDADAVDRWRRLASWSDPTAETVPEDWMNRVLARARTFYGAELSGLTGASSASEILNAMADQECLFLRRK